MEHEDLTHSGSNDSEKGQVRLSKKTSFHYTSFRSFVSFVERIVDNCKGFGLFARISVKFTQISQMNKFRILKPKLF